MTTFFLEHPVLSVLIALPVVMLFVLIVFPPFGWLMEFLLRPVRKPLDWWFNYWSSRQ